MLKHLDKLKPKARARESLQLRRKYDPDFNREAEMQKLMSKMRMQSMRLKMTMELVDVLNETELDKYSAFDTLSKAKRNIARLEENMVTPSPPVAVAVVRPRATAKAVRPGATATTVRPRATATAVRPQAAAAVRPSPPEIPTVRSDRDNTGDDTCQAAASTVQVAAAVAICLTVM